MIDKVNRVAKKEKIFIDTAARDATSLILAEDIMENLAYTVMTVWNQAVLRASPDTCGRSVPQCINSDKKRCILAECRGRI